MAKGKGLLTLFCSAQLGSNTAALRLGVVFYLSRIFFCERVYWVAIDSVPSEPFTTEVLAATKPLTA